MYHKVRQNHELNVPRDLVHTAMYHLDPKGLEARGPVDKKKAKTKGSSSSKGPNFVYSLDGHEKLMGYQNSTYPLAVYGCIYTASRKVLWLRVWAQAAQAPARRRSSCAITVMTEFLEFVWEYLRRLLGIKNMSNSQRKYLTLLPQRF